jgi:SGNH domain (fused to AT3 domains)
VFVPLNVVHPGLTQARIAVLALVLLAALLPAPARSSVEDNGPCRQFRREAGVSVCDFGVAPEQATRNVALVGDSHASHWRAALDVVASEHGWRGMSVTHTSCPFSKATKLTPEPTRAGCARWVRALPGYFAVHPEIDTLFVVGITGGKVYVPPGQTMFQRKVDGYLDAWSDLPDTIKHIVVIRDTPKMTRRTAGCVERAMAAHKLAGKSCAVARGAALAADPQVAAARREPTRHVQVVDLTSRLCNSRQCFPVIGGVLVYKDVHHFTLTFSTSLGPPLARAVDQAMSVW